MVSFKMKNLRGARRRTFLKLVGASAAGLGLERTQLMNYLADSGGHALADDASCGLMNRSVHIYAGVGDLAWFTLLWPMIDVVDNSVNAAADNPALPGDTNGRYPYHAAASAGYTKVYGTVPGAEVSRRLHYGPQAPWTDVSGQPLANRDVTAILQGTNETHERRPKLGGKVSAGVDVAAVCGSIQRDIPCLVPIIAVGNDAGPGQAVGTPGVTTVANGAGMVELFNSASSQGLLLAQQDRELFETYYKAVLGLRYAADAPTWNHQLEVSKLASNLLGKNLKDELEPTVQDLTDYGLDVQPADITNEQFINMENLGRALITSAKAMGKGLTNSVVIDLNDLRIDGTFRDPHDAWTNIPATIATVTLLGQILNQFYVQCEGIVDPTCESGSSLGDRVVLTVHGDTPKTPFETSNWPDGTTGAANWMFIMSNGYLNGGWYGRLEPLNGPGSKNNTVAVHGFDAVTGEEIEGGNSLDYTNDAGAAVAYAVSRGRYEKVSEFYNGPGIDALITDKES